MDVVYQELDDALSNFFETWKRLVACPPTDTISCECETSPTIAREKIEIILHDFRVRSAETRYPDGEEVYH